MCEFLGVGSLIVIIFGFLLINNIFLVVRKLEQLVAKGSDCGSEQGESVKAS
jgi:hypothetical protein